VETNIGKVRMGRTEEAGSKGGSRKEAGGKG